MKKVILDLLFGGIVASSFFNIAVATGEMRSPVQEEFSRIIEQYRSVVKSQDLEVYSRAAKALRLWAAENDPYKPLYHFTGPESWINDPNGPIYYNGQYHLFYQFDPMVPDGKGGVYKSARSWGHAVSKDLIHWQDWPVALWPDTQYDVNGVYSGNTFVHNGQLHALYTGNVGAHAETYGMLAHSEDGGLTFKKEMVMDNSQRPNEASPVHWDAQVWKEGDTFCQLIGGTAPDKSTGVAWLWKSTDLRHWTLQKNIAPEIKYNWFWELPYILPLNDGKFVFMIGAGNPYWVGDYDREKMEFTATAPVRQVDAGAYYSFNPHMVDDKGPNNSKRTIMHGWAVIGTPPQHENYFYWEQAHALPRQISVVDDRLWQEPITEITTLRHDEKTLRSVHVKAGQPTELKNVSGDALELIVTIDKTKAQGGVGLIVRADEQGQGCKVWLDENGHFGIDGCANAHLLPEGKDKQLELRIFIDRGIIEAYCNGVAVINKCFALPENTKIYAFCDQGEMTLPKVTAWKMKSIWKP